MNKLCFGIIGGGFGVYGWLQAILNNKSKKIITLEKYKNVILKKVNLKKKEKIFFKQNVEDIIIDSNIIIIAKRPNDQFDIIKKYIKILKNKYLILEKPIASTPRRAKNLVNILYKNNIKFQTGFILNETKWANTIKNLIISNKINKLEINWNFLANHYLINSKTWKKNYLKGGGALNFYLIHIIFWLSNISNWKINHISKNKKKHEDPKIAMSLKSKNLEIKIRCNTKFLKGQHFKIIGYNNNRMIKKINLLTPFKSYSRNRNIDERVFYLNRILDKISKNLWVNYKLIYKHLDLWNNIYKKHF